MKTIKATRKNEEFDVLVDDDFYYSGMTNIMKNGYVRIHVDKKTVKLHRYVVKAKCNEIVDHINGNKLDNRRCNLRVTTNGQNRANTNKDRGYSIVNGKYLVRITKDKKVISLGRYETPEQAQEIYKLAHAYYFREYSPYHNLYLDNPNETEEVVKKAIASRTGRKTLTPETLSKINDLRSQGLTQRAISKELGIGATTVHEGLKLIKEESK
ncbi:hypothetical protein [Pectobacterium phage PcaP2EGY]